MFDGFPERALDFYEGLAADDTKAYWSDHKTIYERDVRAPMAALLADLEPEFGAGKLFRPYRDLRFAKDKTLYKTHQGAVVADRLYVQISAEGLYVGGGLWHPDRDELLRLRTAVADDRTGPQLVRALDGWTVIGDQLVRVPRPWHADHPREDLLRRKSLGAGRAFEPADWLSTPECGERVRAAWRALRPLHDWLDRHVRR